MGLSTYLIDHQQRQFVFQHRLTQDIATIAWHSIIESRCRHSNTQIRLQADQLVHPVFHQHGVGTMIGEVITQSNCNPMPSQLQQLVFIVRSLEILALVKQRIVADMFLFEHLAFPLIHEHRRIEQRLLSLNAIM